MKRTVQALGPEGFGVYSADLAAFPPVLEPADGLADNILLPGFVDLHIHGGFGRDVMSGSTEELLDLCERLEEVGYEGFLPTTVTAPPAAVREMMERLPTHRAILGVHLEGPFLSPKHPGAQPRDWIVEPPQDASDWDPILDDPRLRLVTMAPEIRGGHALIARLAGRGVVVSMGHTDATFEEAADAHRLGAAHTTHTFNAMRGFHHREAGIAGFAMVTPSLLAELIYDRVHVVPDAAHLLLTAKGDAGVVAVSDGTLASGMPVGSRIEMWGLNCVVGEGDVRLAEGGALAGSAITLLDAFRNLAQDFGPETAIRLCSLNPRRALGMGQPKVWIEVDPDFQVASRWTAPQVASNTGSP
jgi:N-acetylglucosamine-6-phosphate deacetylase